MRSPVQFLFTSRRAAGLILACVLLLAGCLRPASGSTPTAPSTPEPEQWVRVDSVQVIEQTSIEVTGQAKLPPGACVQILLYQNGQPAAWWPPSVCIEPDPGGWQVVIPLGRGKAPGALDPSASYEVRAWWPEREKETLFIYPIPR